MDRVLEKNAFLIKNRIKSITTVFPATTVAVTTSMMVGLNPVETGMLGWNMYYKDIDKTITTFINSEKGDIENKPLEEAINYKNKNMITKSIMEEINERGIDKGYTLFPFGENPYTDLDEMYKIIEDKCNEDGKKYIYAYDIEPDYSMHVFGNEDKRIKEIIQDVNRRVEKLSKNVRDTIIFVIADHGHITVESIFLNDYPQINECLERTTSLEQRAVNFFIKEDKKEEFRYLFEKEFSDDFDLYDKQDVIDSNLFGYGKENSIFRDILGDFLAIAKTNKAILSDGNEVLKSQHAGYTNDEIYIPLIVINSNEIGIDA